MRRFTRTFAVGKAPRLLTWRDSFHAKPSIPDKPIFGPDPKSKLAISRTGLSTLIPRGKHGIFPSGKGGSCTPHLATQEWLTGRVLFAKIPRFRPGSLIWYHAPISPRKSFGERPRLPAVSPDLKARIRL